MTRPEDIVRDVIARVIAIIDALECGDIDLAHTIAIDLETDLVAVIA